MFKLLKLATFANLLFCLSAFAGTAQTEFTYTSTGGTWQLVPNVSATTVFRNVMIENYTDGDIQVAFGSTTFPDFTVKDETDKFIGTEEFFGAAYVRNLTGTGGEIVLRLTP